MPASALRFNDPPDDLLERLKPVLVGHGSPPLFVVAKGDGAIEFTGPGGDFLLQARAAEALTTVWPGWQRALVQ